MPCGNWWRNQVNWRRASCRVARWVESIARAIHIDADNLCQACITGKYPTEAGQRLYQVALRNAGVVSAPRTYERTGAGA